MWSFDLNQQLSQGFVPELTFTRQTLVFESTDEFLNNIPGLLVYRDTFQCLYLNIGYVSQCFPLVVLPEDRCIIFANVFANVCTRLFVLDIICFLKKCTAWWWIVKGFCSRSANLDAFCILFPSVIYRWAEMRWWIPGKLCNCTGLHDIGMIFVYLFIRVTHLPKARCWKWPNISYSVCISN